MVREVTGDELNLVRQLLILLINVVTEEALQSVYVRLGADRQGILRVVLVPNCALIWSS